eukprot:84405-Amphidinium_carterae.1
MQHPTSGGTPHYEGRSPHMNFADSCASGVLRVLCEATPDRSRPRAQPFPSSVRCVTKPTVASLRRRE